MENAHMTLLCNTSASKIINQQMLLSYNKALTKTILKSKSKAIPVTGRERLQRYEMSWIPHFLGN
jgi:hypothetical protein